MKILILASNPRKDLNLEEEIRHLQGVIERSKNREYLEVEVGFAVRPEDLQGLLLKHEPDIVHFCGHGTGEQGLVLQDDTGVEKLVSTDALSNLFELCSEWVKCVLLNACYSDVQANAIIQHVNYAIGMNHEIRDDAAIAFATGFYQALGYGQSIEKSYKFGCNAIQLQISNNSNVRSTLSEEKRQLAVATTLEEVLIPEHLKPILKMRSNSALFIDEFTSNGKNNLLPATKLNIQSSIDKALEKANAVRQEREKTSEYRIYPTIQFLTPKIRTLFFGGILATLALVSTSSWVDNLLLSGQNQVNQTIESGGLFSNPNAESFLSNGLDKANQGDYEKAIEDYTRAIELQPDYFFAYYNRGLAYFKLRNNQSAIADYTKAIGIKSNNANAYFNRGLAYFKLGNNQSAIADYTKAIKLNDKYAYAYNNRGLAYFKLGNNQSAIADYTKAIEIDDRYAYAYNNRGIVHSKLGNNQDAIADYTKAIKLNDKYDYAYNNRGLAYFKLGNNQSAIADYTKAIEINDKYAYAYNNRGTVHSKLENYPDAIADYTKAITIKPNYTYVYFKRSLAYSKLGDNQQAREDRQKFEELYQQQENAKSHQNTLNNIKSF